MSRPATRTDAEGSAPSTNELKYQTSNPVVQRLIGGFFATLRDVVAPLAPRSVLDAGCGEGEALARLADLLPDRVSAIDLDPRAAERARDRLPQVDVGTGSVLELGFEDSSFDLVLCLEVLEHVPGPEAGVAELARVAASDVVVSVPYEPWFRLGSLLRGKHVRALGNHPEHINHFNRRSLAALVDPYLEVVQLRVAFPWLIVHGRPRA